MRSIHSFSNYHRNMVSSWQVCGWLLRFKQSSQPANRQLANQFSMKMELETPKLHFRANLLCTQMERHNQLGVNKQWWVYNKFTQGMQSISSFPIFIEKSTSFIVRSSYSDNALTNNVLNFDKN
jgi:hypothetical protein